MQPTNISWTDYTWNPTRGCTRVSEGCRNCYAEALSARRHWTNRPWTKRHETENVQWFPKRLGEPYRVREDARVFVNSMSDLFHEQVPTAFLDDVFQVIEACEHLTFQILTKRPERAAAYRLSWPDNVWLGTSVESPRETHRIESLLGASAAVHFISVEPLLAPLPHLPLEGIDWVIVGGESGSGYRPMEMAWARQIQVACQQRNIAFFFRQDSAFHSQRKVALEAEDGRFWICREWPDERLEPYQVPTQMSNKELAPYLALPA